MDSLELLSKEDLKLLLGEVLANQTELRCAIEQKLAPHIEGCNADFDKLLCWPQTPPDTVAYQPCFRQLNGIQYDTTQNASRRCFPNGTWHHYTDYSACKEIHNPDLYGVEITSTIYVVGYTISLVALFIAVFIFSRFKDLRCLRNSIHMNLMCSYIFADSMWIIIYTIQVNLQMNTTTCIFLILLLHYFHLTNFFWMFVEGLYLYILVAKTFTGKHIKLRVYAIIGWGGPIIFVLIWGIAKSFTLSSVDQQLQSNGSKTCPWTPHVFDWIYQFPAILVLVVNVVFLVIIMWVLITKLRSANSAETQQYRKAAKALLVLIPLLGVTYILVIVGPTEGISGNIYDYTRAVLLSTQGFTVALFYCFVNAEVKNTIKHHFNSWHTHRNLGSRRTRYSSSRDWSPRSRGDSMRLYQGSNFFKKRESTCSIGTTTTLITINTGKNNSAIRSPLLNSGEGG